MKGKSRKGIFPSPHAISYPIWSILSAKQTLIQNYVSTKNDRLAQHPSQGGVMTPPTHYVDRYCRLKAKSEHYASNFQ